MAGRGSRSFASTNRSPIWHPSHLRAVDNPPPYARQRLQSRPACYRRGANCPPFGRITMRITLVGSRHFGVTTLNMLKAHGVEIARVVVHDAEDRLAAAAKAAGIEVVVQKDPKLVVAAEIAPNTDLIVTAHSHARVGSDALA